MKENNVWLSPKELKLMLQGSLLWIDVAPRVTPSKGMRKLGEVVLEKPAIPKSAEQINQTEERVYTKRLEGQPVIWLLGSVGFLTLSSWFYFVLFSK